MANRMRAYRPARRSAYIVVDGVRITAPPADLGYGAIPGIVTGGISLVGSLLGGNKKDPGRLAANAKYDNECRAGVQDACTALKHMSGRYGLTNEGRYCNEGGCSGWATGKAKDDAYSRWQSIEASRGGRTAPTPALPVPTQSTPVPSSIPGQDLPPVYVPVPGSNAPPVIVHVPANVPVPSGPVQQLPELVSYAQPAQAGMSPATLALLALIGAGLVFSNQGGARQRRGR